MSNTETGAESLEIAHGVDDEPIEANRRLFDGWRFWVIAAYATIYAAFHMAALNGISISAWTGIELPFLPNLPMETWNFRIVHISGALGLGFLLYHAANFREDDTRAPTPMLFWAALAFAIPGVIALITALGYSSQINSGELPQMGGLTTWPSFPGTPLFASEVWWFGIPLLISTFGAIVLGWFERTGRDRFRASDAVLVLNAVVVAVYLIAIYSTAARNSVGTALVPIGIAFAATAGSAMILELTRRMAGLALVIITAIFLIYTFTAHLLPGILKVQTAYTWQRFFGFLYTDAGILGPTTAVSSTYIILFVIFAAFLQASKVGDYFVNFAFAAAGRARGGPAKVAIFASGLMGMINGTSAGNVVATGSLTIPLMKKVGYHRRTAGAVEAAASTGGQIMPPIMGAGAFIMAEITGIPYTEIAVAAIIPAILYFVSVYFMVDFEAAKLGMRGMREDELPVIRQMLKRVYLFIPIIILIYALFVGYSVIRAGTLATVAAAVVSLIKPDRNSYIILAVLLGALLSTYLFEPVSGWVASNSYVLGILAMVAIAVWALFYRGAGMKPRGVAQAFEMAGIMSIQIIAVCACAGIIVGVISLTGVGARFSALLLGIAGSSQLLALFFAMCIAILLGMGMPTTAAYAVAGSVVAPGLQRLLFDGGLPEETSLLVAHFFVFYYAVLSAITPPVALASYAAAGISGANPMETSVTSFKFGLAAFIVPFMCVYNSALLMDGTWFEVIRAGTTAVVGVFLLSAGVQGWFMGARSSWIVRLILLIAALFMIEGGGITDLIGIALAAGAYFVQKVIRPDPDAPISVGRAD